MSNQNQQPINLPIDNDSYNYASVKNNGQSTISTSEDEERMDHSEVRNVRPQEVMREVQNEQMEKQMQPGVAVNIEHENGDAYGSK